MAATTNQNNNIKLYANSLLGGSGLKKNPSNRPMTLPIGAKNLEQEAITFTFKNHLGGFTSVYINADNDVVNQYFAKSIEIPFDGVITPILSNCPKGSYSKSFFSLKGFIDTVIFIKNNRVKGSNWEYEVQGTTGYIYTLDCTCVGITKTKTIKNQRFHNLLEIEQKLYSSCNGKKELTLVATSWYAKGVGLIDRVISHSNGN